MASKVHFLPKDVGSLSGGPPPGARPHPPGTLFVLGAQGGMSVEPDAGFRLLFGRDEPEVHVCVGLGDTYVSRRHGLITRQDSRWLLTNTGRRPIRLAGSRLVLGGDQAELPLGYTPLFILAPRQEHLLEVRVSASASPPGPGSGHGSGYGEDVCEASTAEDPRELDDTERLVIACLAQRYLRNEPQPQPLTWAQVAEELNGLRRGADTDRPWTQKRAAHVVAKVRRELSRKGVYGLVESEVPPPVGNALNHNLIIDLLTTVTIGKDDLGLLRGAGE
ncbi:hypothetical protein ACTWP5_28115 [Streptomyces sp. 4N509B]|uniref:hypothetical protein n=1 Tax=Streptomyces sp. 4N509B TaxID=3457413 RepID=UPI003FD5C0B5